MEHEGDNPSKRDGAEDRPGRRTRSWRGRSPSEWRDGKTDDAAVTDMLAALRQANPDTAADKVVELLNNGIAPQSVWDAMFAGANELLMRAPGIRSLHAVTTTNALHYAFKTSASDETRRWLLLQNASYIPLFRGDPGNGVEIDKFEPVAPQAGGAQALEEIFASVSKDNNAAAAKALAHLKAPEKASPSAPPPAVSSISKAPTPTITSSVPPRSKITLTSRRNGATASSPASVFWFKGSSGPDSSLVERTRAALGSA